MRLGRIAQLDAMPPGREVDGLDGRRRSVPLAVDIDFAPRRNVENKGGGLGRRGQRRRRRLRARATAGGSISCSGALPLATADRDGFLAGALLACFFGSGSDAAFFGSALTPPFSAQALTPPFPVQALTLPSSAQALPPRCAARPESMVRTWLQLLVPRSASACPPRSSPRAAATATGSRFPQRRG